MNKRITLLAAIALLAAVVVNSANYISLGEEVRIPPRYLDGYYHLDARMVVDGMLDDWQITAEYPDQVMVKLVSGIVPLDGMSVTYTDRTGAEQIYQAPLQVSAAYSTISSHIGVQGWWDYNEDGEYEPYGTAKWQAGEYDMFTLNLYIGEQFRSGDITFDGMLTSGSDQRGAVLQGVRFFKRTHLWVGYMKGDVSGNERVDVGDITLLVALVLGNADDLDEFQLAAADINDDGQYDVCDVTHCITLALN